MVPYFPQCRSRLVSLMSISVSVRNIIGLFLWKSLWRILIHPTPGYHVLCRVDYPENIEGSPKCSSYGCFLQAVGKITLGEDVWLAPNVGIITAGHDFDDLSKNSAPKSVTIGDHCWIGMNAVILPGVILGNHTMVGAGSVVTKSFPEGDCVIAGNPARVIKRL
jgi:acetyltransferase-like isoleucine patch superfamily enzyme